MSVYLCIISCNKISKDLNYPSSNSMKGIKLELKLTGYAITAELKYNIFIYITNIT